MDKNENIQGKFEVAPVRDKMGYTKRSGHVQRKPLDKTLKRTGCLNATWTWKGDEDSIKLE